MLALGRLWYSIDIVTMLVGWVFSMYFMFGPRMLYTILFFSLFFWPLPVSRFLFSVFWAAKVMGMGYKLGGKR